MNLTCFTHLSITFRFGYAFRYHWMHNATAYNHAYSDSGLFCIHASAHPSHLGELTQVLTREFAAMAGHVGKEELQVRELAGIMDENGSGGDWWGWMGMNSEGERHGIRDLNI